MKALLILALLGGAAWADDRGAIEAAVRAKTMAPKAWVVGTAPGAAATVSALTVDATDAAKGGGWFHGAMKEGATTTYITGIAAKQPDKTWAIAVEMFAPAIPDAELWKRAIPRDAGAAPPYDDVLGSAMFSIVTQGLDTTMAAAAAANGTAPGETCSTAAACAKLASVWSKLDMELLEFTQARAVVPGRLAFALGKVMLPAKKKDTIVPLTVGIVMVNVKGEWRWAVVSFAAP
ncbi:MAG TPA: hypothetical protein VGM88_12505 [Kofleriaceae bacterium]|jgi:hypothetical protein